MDRRMFLGGVGAIMLAPTMALKPKPEPQPAWGTPPVDSVFIESLGRWISKEQQFAAILFRDFVFWTDELNHSVFCEYDHSKKSIRPALDQTIHGWVVEVKDIEYMHVYQITLSNCTGVHTNSIPLKVYKHRVSSKENFMDYLCGFTVDWIMGESTYKQYLPPVKEWYKLGEHFQTGAIF